MSTAAGETNVDPEEARKAAINELANMIEQEYRDKGEQSPSRQVVWREAARRYRLLENSNPLPDK